MLDNVVEVNGLPLEQQRDEIMRKRRHGMGFLGLGSHDHAARHEVRLARSRRSSPRTSRASSRSPAGKRRSTSRKEKGPAPDHERGVRRSRAEMLRKRPEMARDGWQGRATLIPGRVLHARYSRYMQRVAEAAPELVDAAREASARASRITARSRRPARSRCRSRTMRRTASSRRSRTTISAT